MWAFLLLAALPDPATENRLLAQARQGHQTAIAAIYEHYFEVIYQFIRWRVDDDPVAEDLTSDVFIRLLSVLGGEHAPQQSLRGWLFQVARNTLTDHYRAQKRATTADLDENLASDLDIAAQFAHAEDAERVRRALKTLAEDQQEVLILRFGQMLSLDNTAESMGRSVSAIKSLQFRAIQSLRQRLDVVEN